MYAIVFPLNGWDWLWIGLAVAMDIFMLHQRRVQAQSHSVLPRKRAVMRL